MDLTAIRDLLTRSLDDRKLSRLIDRASSDKAFYAALKLAVQARTPLFAPAAERLGLEDVLAEFRAEPM